MRPNFNQHEFIKFEYKKALKKDVSKVGTLLISYFIVMLAASLIVLTIPKVLSYILPERINTSTDNTSFLMLSNSIASLIAFFAVSIIYCICTKSNAGQMFPLDNVPFKLMCAICSFGLAIAMCANYASNLVLILFKSVGIDAYVNADYPCNSALDVVLFYISVAIIPALAEEFAFRGIILNLLKKYSKTLAVVVSGVMFGLIHGNFTQIPFAVIVGLALGFIAVKTNSLLPGIIIHFLNNSISVTFTLLSQNSIVPEYAINFIYTAIMLTVAIFGIVSFIYLNKKYKYFFMTENNDNILPFKEKVKTAFGSVTIIVFTLIMLLEAVASLTLEV